MKIELTNEEALVLSDWLYKRSEKKEYFDDISEQYVLWAIEAQLDKLLPELVDKDYTEKLDTARKIVRESY